MRRLLRGAVLFLAAVSALTGGTAYGRGHGRGMSPRGASGFGLVFAAAAAQAAQRQAWEARERAAAAARKARNNTERVTFADKARQQGNPHLAAMLYLRVALSKPKSPLHAKAKKALTELASQGRAEMKKADQLLDEGKVPEAFEKLDYLNWAYEDVPQFNEEISSHVARLRNDPKNLAVLNEGGAKRLLQAAKKHEADDEICCAYLAYEEAAKLLPAQSAKVAAERLKELKADPEIVAEAEECRAIQECLHVFHKAELLEKTAPARAAELFKQILKSSPDDSEVYKCAREELAKIASR